MSDKEQIIQRWDTYIDKIKTRCNEMIAQANAGTDAFVPQLMFDTNAVNNAWTGIKGQVFQLSDKLDAGWDKMDELFEKAGSTSKEWDRERAKLDEANIYLQWEYEKNYILAMAKAARQVLFNVKSHINENKIHTCTQCGNELDINVYSFRAKNIKCDACQSVNTYKPDDRIIALEAWVLVPLANEHVLTEKEKEYFAEERRSYADHRNMISEKQNEELISLRKATWNKYYQFLIDSIPEKADLYERQRDERLKWSERSNY